MKGFNLNGGNVAFSGADTFGEEMGAVEEKYACSLR